MNDSNPTRLAARTALCRCLQGAGAWLALAGSALAQGQVTIAGRVDLSVDHVRTDARSNVGYGVPKGTVTRMSDNTSRLSFTGTESLGGGAAAVFGLEFGINADDGSLTSPPFRFSYVGLRGAWGTAVAGRLDSGAFSSSPAYSQAARNVSWVVHDAGVVAIGTRILNGRNRVSNAVSYVAPTVGGFSGAVRLNLAGPETPSTTNPSQKGEADLRQWQMSLNYDLGGLRAGVAYGKDDKDGGFGANDFRSKRQVVLSYAFDGVRPYALWGRDSFENTATTRREVTYWLVGLNAARGAHGFIVNHMQRDVQSGLAGAMRKTQLGYTYNLGPRTSLYAFFDRDDSNTSLPDAVARGIGSGIQHRF